MVAEDLTPNADQWLPCSGSGRYFKMHLLYFLVRLICFLDLTMPHTIRDFEFIRLGVLDLYYCYFMAADILL